MYYVARDFLETADSDTLKRIARTTIGENSVIGAGSIVTKSIPENCVDVGNPCRVIRQIDNNKTEKTNLNF